MKVKKNMIKRTASLLAAVCLSSTVFAQEANDGFIVPLNEDFSKPAQQTAEIGDSLPASNKEAAPAGKFSNLSMGLWVQTQNVNESLIRNVSDSKKKGYEFDNSHFKTEANWWFWGNVSENVFLSSEISVLNFDKTLYQENTYAANVPDVTWADGAQSVAEMFSSPYKKGNDEGLGYFKKMAVNLTTPYVITKFGYGDVGEDSGMSHFDGIFNVIDYKDWNGYTEIKNGPEIQQFGDFKVDAAAGFSDKVDNYGTYDYIDVKYADKAEIAFTFGSSSTEEQLFFYNKTNTNAFSAYAAFNPLENLKLEAHLLGTFGTGDDMELGKDTLAFAGRVSWKADTWKASIMQSLAGLKVDSVWGSDGKVYDDINANTATTQFDAEKSFADLKTPLTLALDQGFTYTLNDDSDTGAYDGMLSFRTEPYADIDVSELLGKNLTVGVYGVMSFDKLSKNQSEDKNLVTSFNEGGIELVTENAIPFVKKTSFDYAIKREFGDWESGSSYPLNITYHSIMLNSDITDRLSVTFGSVVRDDKTDDKDLTVPFAFAMGASIKDLPLPGKPMLWAHFTYSMFPYTDTNYNLRRYDEENSKYAHRTYLLNELDGSEDNCKYKSRVSLGLVWNL